MGKVLVPQEIADEGIRALEDAGHEVKMGSGAKEEDLIRDVKDCDAILLRTAMVTAEVLAAGKKLKIVARHGAGYNNVDLEAADRLGIWVTNAPDSTTESVAEFTLGALIASAKRTFLLNKAMKNSDFYFKNNHKGVELAGKTLAIIGFGRIGSSVAKKAYYGLDMKIISYTPAPAKRRIPEYVRLVEWAEAFSQGDFVSLHMPLTKDNRGCIGERELDMMKKSAYLINCARGELVQERSLIRALRGGKLAGAYLDVFETEPPLPENPLLLMDNVIVSPHMASNTEECMIRMAAQSASQINMVLSGQKPLWPVNHPEVILENQYKTP